ncbi:MAG: hypothetical protein ABR579_03810 [Actinomycetota bacterium]
MDREWVTKAAATATKLGKAAVVQTKNAAATSAPYIKKGAAAAVQGAQAAAPKLKEGSTKGLAILRKHPELIPIAAGLAIAVGPELAIGSAAIEGSALLASALFKIWDEYSGKEDAKLTKDEHRALQDFTQKLKARRSS